MMPEYESRPNTEYVPSNVRSSSPRQFVPSYMVKMSLGRFMGMGMTVGAAQ